jgi:hypothetical protein
MRNQVLSLSLVLAGLAVGCGGEETGVTRHITSVDASAFPANYARQWMTNLENSIKGDIISPPVAARIYAYGAIAMYEAVVHGMPGYQSLAGQLNGLDSLPTPHPSLEYDWPTVLAQTMHRMVLASVPAFPGAVQRGPYVFPNRIFFEYTTTSQSPLTTLGPAQIGFRRTAGVSEEVIANSIAFADELATALIAWTEQDSYYDVRYRGFVAPVGPDKWVPTGFNDPDRVAIPLEPYFGEVRTLALNSGDECSPANLGLSPPPFSTDPASAFYAQGLATYNTSLTLTEEQRITARYWADGPGETGTPAGHWVAITSMLVRNGNLADAARAYAFVSIGFLDSFIAVWQSKYVYNLLRPTTYIRRHIDADWLPLLPTPQFPTYVSGHSGQSGASARLLTAIFGSGPFTDTTKIRRGFAPRTFANFDAAAEEAALSREYGGIHFPMDDNDGLVVGRCVGDKVIERVQLQE